MADEEDYYFSSGDEGIEEEEEDEFDQDDDFEENVMRDCEGDLEETGSWSLSSVITKESLLAAQKEDLRKVMDLLALREQHARTLLIYHRWDVERICELLEQKGRERLFADAGVHVVENAGPALSESSDLVTCNICFEDFAPHLITTMDCGHFYCNSCWTEHFIIKINDGQSRRIRCMTPKCNAVCDEATVRSLVSEKDPDLADRFDRFLLESYIEDNNKVKWCPSVPHCGNAIRVEGDIYCEVECTCGLQFCFNCLSVAHSPCSCIMWELWSKKCQDESENVNWITVHTKPCPKCHKSVEKNGGCNLVVCVCGQAFCWICAASTGRDHTWTSITGHSCGRYKQDQEERVERARRNLNRYMHYHNRYKAHCDSLKQENKLRETVEEKISISESKDSKIKDYSWVHNGLYRLSRARRILSYSYPFAFYMFGDELFKDEMTPQEREMKQNLFEDQQQQLESNIEKLSMFLEKDFQNFTDEQVMDIMMHVINLSAVVDTLCKEMYKCIENDLLYPLQGSTQNIAPYKSKGLKRASEVSVPCDLEHRPSSVKAYDASTVHANGGATEAGIHPGCQLHGFSTRSGESEYSSWKRAKKDARGGTALFDLNIPAEAIEKS